MALPSKGLEHDKIKEILNERKGWDLKPSEGTSWAYVYDHSKEHTEFLTEIHDMFIHTNMLNPLKFVSLRNMECETCAMSASIFNGDPNVVVGNVSSGGSESLALAILSMRGRGEYFGIKKP